MKQPEINDQKHVTVCVVTYNRPQMVKECLASIYASTHRDYNVILFDNHSTEPLENSIWGSYVNLHYIYYPQNIGVAGGRNYCERIAKSEYLMFLDDDTVIDREMLKELVKVLSASHNIAIVAPKMYFYDQGKTNILLGGLGKISNWNTLCTDLTSYKEDIGQYESVMPIDYAQNGFMVKRQISRRINGHDSKLQMTFAETDYFKRVQKLGYQAVYVPTAKLWHHTRLKAKNNTILRDKLGLDRAERIFFNMRNRSVFVSRHYGIPAKLCYIALLVHLFYFYYFYKFLLYKAPKSYHVNLLKGYIDGIMIFLQLKSLV